MQLDRVWMMRAIPHHGRMCLLDEVVSWDSNRISCSSTSHRSSTNPLRARGRLGVACGIEYAAQAMAVHGALLAATPTSGSSDAAPSSSGNAARLPAAEAMPAPAGNGSGVSRPALGFLAALRGVEFHVLRLDDVPGPLLCDAVRMAGDGGMAIYEFTLGSGERRLLGGRATVILEPRE